MVVEACLSLQVCLFERIIVFVRERRPSKWIPAVLASKREPAFKLDGRIYLANVPRVEPMQRDSLSSVKLTWIDDTHAEAWLMLEHVGTAVALS